MAVRESLTRSGRAWLDEENGIVQFRASGVDQDLEDAKANMVAIKEVSGDRVYPMLVDLTGAKGLRPDARDYYGSPFARTHYRAMALVGTSPVSRMLANVWFTLFGDRNAPSVKVFSNLPDAIKWLKGFGG